MIFQHTKKKPIKDQPMMDLRGFEPIHNNEHDVYLYTKQSLFSQSCQKIHMGHFLPIERDDEQMLITDQQQQQLLLLQDDDTHPEVQVEEKQILFQMELGLHLMSLETNHETMDFKSIAKEQHCFGRIIDSDIWRPYSSLRDYSCDHIVILAENGLLTNARFCQQAQRFVVVHHIDLFDACKAAISTSKKHIHHDDIDDSSGQKELVSTTRMLPSQRLICGQNGKFLIICGLQDNVYCYPIRSDDDDDDDDIPSFIDPTRFAKYSDQGVIWDCKVIRIDQNRDMVYVAVIFSCEKDRRNHTHVIRFDLNSVTGQLVCVVQDSDLVVTDSEDLMQMEMDVIEYEKLLVTTVIEIPHAQNAQFIICKGGRMILVHPFLDFESETRGNTGPNFKTVHSMALCDIADMVIADYSWTSGGQGEGERLYISTDRRRTFVTGVNLECKSFLPCDKLPIGLHLASSDVLLAVESSPVIFENENQTTSISRFDDIVISSSRIGSRAILRIRHDGLLQTHRIS